MRPRTLSACVFGHTHAHAKDARTDVGRSPCAIDSRVRVGVPRSLARVSLSRRTLSVGRTRVRLARTYLVVRLDAVRRLAAGGWSLCTPSLALFLSLGYRWARPLLPIGRGLGEQARAGGCISLSFSLPLALSQIPRGPLALTPTLRRERPGQGWLSTGCRSSRTQYTAHAHILVA